MPTADGVRWSQERGSVCSAVLAVARVVGDVLRLVPPLAVSTKEMAAAAVKS